MRLIIVYTRYFSKRILFLLYLGFFVYLYYALRQYYFDFYTVAIPNPFYDFFAKMTTFIFSVVIFVIFGFTTTLLEIILAFTNSTAKTSTEKRKAKIHADINNTLFEHISTKTDIFDDKLYISRFKRKYLTDYPRLVFINRLRRIMLLTEGDVHQRCIRIFTLLRVKGLLWAYLHSPYPRHKLFAIKIIGEFHLVRFTNCIRRLMKKRNPAIASEAMYAYAKLAPQTDFTFIIKRRKPISKLDFFNFVQIASDYKNLDYEALISNISPVISAFGIRMAGLHKVVSMKSTIQKRVTDKNKIRSEEAQNSFLLLVDDTDVAFIFEKFDAFTIQNQKKILQLLSDYIQLPFVSNFYHRIIENYDYDMKLKAMDMLIQKSTVEAFRYSNHSDTMVRNVYKQLTDFNT